MRLFDSARPTLVCPGVVGSSGTVLRNVSSRCLNDSTEQFAIFHNYAGNV